MNETEKYAEKIENAYMAEKRQERHVLADAGGTARGACQGSVVGAAEGVVGSALLGLGGAVVYGATSSMGEIVGETIHGWFHKQINKK